MPTGMAQMCERCLEQWADYKTLWITFAILAAFMWVALMVQMPGVLTALFVLATPVLLRRITASRRRKDQTKTVRAASIIAALLAWTTITAVVGVTSAAAFFVICSGPPFGSLSFDDLEIAAITGMLALIIAVLLYSYFRPIKD